MPDTYRGRERKQSLQRSLRSLAFDAGPHLLSERLSSEVESFGCEKDRTVTEDQDATDQTTIFQSVLY